MFHLILIVGLTGIILIALMTGFKWLKKNQVKVRLNRLPTGREMLFLSMAWRILRTIFLRVLLRR